MTNHSFDPKGWSNIAEQIVYNALLKLDRRKLSLPADKELSLFNYFLFLELNCHREQIAKLTEKSPFRLNLKNGKLIETFLPLLPESASELKVRVSEIRDLAISSRSKKLFQTNQAGPNLMVNLKSKAVKKPTVISDLTDKGIRLFRINCAFGDQKDWKAIRTHIDLLNKKLKNKTKLLLDLAGPKNRIKGLFIEGEIQAKSLVKTGDVLRLRPSPDNKDGLQIIPELPDFLPFCQLGHTIRFDDAKIQTQVIQLSGREVKLKVVSVLSGACDLEMGKGINLPDYFSPSEGLNKKDKKDLVFALENADIISFSFTQSASDIHNYIQTIREHQINLPPIVIKIETAQAIANLEEIVLAVLEIPDCTLLVARGDLVSECGFSELAKLQEVIAQHAQAANLPWIVATEILESFVQNGIPLRSELIDHSISKQADAILLNEGPYLLNCIDYLNAR